LTAVTLNSTCATSHSFWLQNQREREEREKGGRERDPEGESEKGRGGAEREKEKESENEQERERLTHIRNARKHASNVLHRNNRHTPCREG
jgi:hypothetical protein